MDKPIRHSRRLHTGRMRTDTGAFGQVRSIVLRRYPHRDPNSARRGCFGSATALATAMTSSTRVCMPIGVAGRRSRHARAHVFCCVFCLVTGGFGGFDGGFWVFATRRWMVVFPGFLGCLVWSGLRWWLGWCKLFPCCRSARVAPLGWFGLAERWWFENSRACLYYFVESF